MKFINIDAMLYLSELSERRHRSFLVLYETENY